MAPPPAEHFAARIFLGPALRSQPDRRLVALVRDGYDAAFEEIVRRYRRPLDRFAAAIVGGRSEDVTQDAFSKALLALRGSEAEIELRPWLYRIVRNTALNDLRDRAPAVAEIPEALAGGRSAAVEAEAREELAELMERLRALPDPQRAALVMRELEGLSHEEIATALGVTGGAARQAIHRARTALRDGVGLLVPLPVLRVLVDHSGEAAVAGGALAASAGASSAGGAALGGLGGGAAKVGVATVLIAGAVGGGVAIEQRDGGTRGPEAAQAAPAPGEAQQLSERSGSRSSGSGNSGEGSGGSGESSGPSGGQEDRSGENRGGGDQGNDDRGGHDSGSGDDTDSSGPSENSGPGSIGSSGPSDDDDAEDRSGSTGSGSSGSSGFSGSGSSGSSRSGGGEVELEAEPVEPVIESSSGSSGSSGSDSSGSGSGDLDDN
jgi:RNA polymerase sigma factor (sigma-70 family)